MLVPAELVWEWSDELEPADDRLPLPTPFNDGVVTEGAMGVVVSTLRRS